MPKLYLFGSVARGEDAPKDIDVLMIPADADCVKRLEPYAIENGGRLDLFFFAGDALWPAYDDTEGMRRIMLSKHTKDAIAADLTEITFEKLIHMMEDFGKD